MYRYTPATTVVLPTIVLGALIVTWLFVFGPDEASGTEIKTTPVPYYSVSSSTLPIAVGGIVTATDKAVVSAKTAGVITHYHVAEGSHVRSGDVLVTQATPIADAELNLRTAESLLTGVTQASAVHVSETTAAKAHTVAVSAAELAALNGVGGDDRVSEATAGLQVTIQQSVTTILDALQFVKSNRDLFSADSMNTYDLVVNDLYATVPKHFQSSLVKPDASSEDILEALAQNVQSGQNAILDTQNLAQLLDVQLQALVKVYAGAEEDVFDRTRVAQDSDVYESYFVRRNALTESQSALTTQFAATRTTIDARREEVVKDGEMIAVTQLEEAAAVRQADFSVQIAAAAARVADAAHGVSLALEAQGQVEAPFAGVVGQRFKREGEYAVPGEPLLVLDGVSGMEVTVTVPKVLAPTVAIGQHFLIDGMVRGVVDRFARTSDGNSFSVVIVLDDSTLAIGQSVRGVIEAKTSETVYAVPRSYVHMASTGAFVRTDDDAELPVVIRYDAGDTLFVEGLLTSGTALVPAYSISVP